MPKTPVITVTTDLDAIMAQIADIEHLLEGRLDSDNIQVEGGDISRISGSSVYGIADFGRPVIADKLIADYSGSDPDVQSISFEDDVYLKLINKIKDTPQFDISKVKFAFDITNKEEGIKPESESIVKFSGELSAEEEAIVLKRKNTYDEYKEKLSLWEARRSRKMKKESDNQRFISLKSPSRPEISGISVLGEGYLQTKFIKHPPNFKVANKWDIYRFALLKGTRFAPIITENDKDYLEEEPAVSSSVSVKYKSSTSGWFSIPYTFELAHLDPETTAITMFLNTEIRPDSDTDFLTVLCDVEILFKVLP